MKKVLFLMMLVISTSVFAETSQSVINQPVQMDANSVADTVKTGNAGQTANDAKSNDAAANTTQTTDNANSNDAQKSTETTNEAIDLTETWKLAPETQHEENAELRYAIDVNYPQIQGDNLSNEAQQFNKLVKQLMEQEVQQFKKYVAVDMPHMQALPDDLKHNSLHMDYDIDVVRPNDKILISVRLSNEGFQAGRAHPYHTHRVLNYDLNTGKILTLAALFKPKSNYLTVISKYANKKLNEKLDDKWMINDGTKPIEKNYQIWNLENDGLLITFDEYQVAPYVYGAQEVEIPYSELKSVLSPKSVISSCVADPDSCEGIKTKV